MPYVIVPPRLIRCLKGEIAKDSLSLCYKECPRKQIRTTNVPIECHIKLKTSQQRATELKYKQLS